MAMEIFKLIGSIFVDNSEADKSLHKTDKKAEGLGHRFLSVGKSVGKFALGAAGAIAGVGTALVAVAENTREYRTEQGKLHTAFESANFSGEEAKRTYRDLNGILGDSGQAVEAANHLAKLASNQEELSTWTKICTGVFGTFGDSLPIEGLTEAANETAKTGSLTGALADALNWAGANEDKFQDTLDACSSEQERQALITETLNGLYSDAADKYREVNAEVIKANEAQDRLNEAMSRIGGAIEPLITQGKILLAEIFDRLMPAVEWINTTAVPWLISGINQLSEWIGGLMQRLSDSGVTVGNIFAQVQQLWTQTLEIIRDIWDRIGKPLWDAVLIVVDTVKSYFVERMPQIQESVRHAFAEIQAMWVNHLRPALQAIAGFIKDYLAPAFKWAFENVIAPVVDTCFGSIVDIWENLLKPALRGILDFLATVFSANFEDVFRNLVDKVASIWDGLKSAIKRPINAVIDIINGFTRRLSRIKIPDWIPAIGGASISIPQIPHLEKGGILERGQMGLLEGNGAEAVVPLEKNKKWISAVAEDMDAQMGGTRTMAMLMDIRKLLQSIAEMGIVLDTGELVGGLARPMDRELGRIQARKARG